METTTGTFTAAISGVLAPPNYSSISTYPYNTVVLIETVNPNNPSGVVIGPHTILTASHMLWDSAHQGEANQVWLYPAYYQNGIPNPPGSLGPINANLVWHNYIVGVPGQNLISQSDSQYDFAVIDTDYTFTSWMGVSLDYGGGAVNVTGYPATANGIQTSASGVVSKDPNYSLLDYPNNFVSPGNSGGPLWNYFNGSFDVVGVSTGLWGPS
jgi:V8-like Glu-specific endopeptidase